MAREHTVVAGNEAFEFGCDAVDASLGSSEEEDSLSASQYYPVGPSQLQLEIAILLCVFFTEGSQQGQYRTTVYRTRS